jgi:phage-related protein
METFEDYVKWPNGNPVQCNVGSGHDRGFRVLEARFGDGYTQRTRDGLNTSPRSYSLVFDPVSAAIADAIESFLLARGGSEPFYWTPPRAIDPVRVICPKIGRTYSQWSHDGVRVTFIEDFGLAS